MLVLDRRTVKLTPEEMSANDRFEQWLDQGYSIPQAVAKVQEECHGDGVRLTTSFWVWLGR